MAKVSFEEIAKRMERMKLPSAELIVGIEEGGTIPATMISHITGRDLKFVRFNYRDKENNPQHREPILIGEFEPEEGVKSVLLVDDVSVSGKTLDTAKRLFKDIDVKTLVLKGKADYVLFPEIEECVDWPWKDSSINLNRFSKDSSPGEHL